MNMPFWKKNGLDNNCRKMPGVNSGIFLFVYLNEKRNTNFHKSDNRFNFEEKIILKYNF